FLMLLSISMTIITIAVSFLLLYSTTMRYTRSMADDISRSEFEYIVTTVERDYNNLINISNSINNNNKLKDLIMLLKSEDTDISEYKKAYDYITEFLIGLKNANSFIKSISIISGEERLYTLDYLFSHDLAEELKDENINGMELCYPADIGNGISFGPPIYSLIDSLNGMVYIKFGLSDSTSFYGNVYILLNNSMFSRMAEGNENLLIYDNKDTVLYNSMGKYGSKFNNKNAEAFLKELESQGSVTVYRQMMDNGWTVAYMIDRTVFSDNRRIAWMIIISIFAGFICSVFISSRLSGNILRPVVSLVKLLSGYGEEHKKYNINISKRKISLRTKIFGYFLATTILPVLIFLLLFYTQSMSLIKEQILKEYDITFTRMAKNVDKHFTDKSSAFQNLLYNIAVQEYLFNRSQGDEANIRDILTDYKYLGLEDNRISFNDNDCRLVFSNYLNTAESMDKNTLLNLQNLKQGFIWFYSRDELNRNILTLGTRVKAISVVDSNNRTIYGRLEMQLRDINSIYENLETSASHVFISDNSGRDITSEFSKSLFEKPPEGISGSMELNSDGKKYMVYYHSINKTQWKLVAKYDFGDITEQGYTILSNNIYIIMIIILLIIVFSYFISLLILKPANAFNNIMEDYRLGDDVNADIMADNFIYEIDSLGISFNKMIERIEDLFDNLLIANREKNQLKFQIKAAEMVALQAQINPHFLYNTLNNLIFLIDNGYKEKAHIIVSSLVKLFRFGISRGDRIITISEEIAYAKAYAEIISIRYGEAIIFEWDVCERLLEYRTLKLILQPLMENSVQHGFRDKQSGCIIKVKCFKDGNAIKFSVSDNGNGITEAELDKIRTTLASDNIDDRVGIYNVQARIRLQYGREYGLELDSIPETGTTVTITIPVDEEGLERL
ncbi:MAG: histidine kinase, partial [Clostridiaceae bacterium]